MRNLLQANLFRLFRSWVFWGAMLVMVGGALTICIGAYHDMVLYNEPGYIEPLDKTLFRAEQVLGITVAIVVSLFVGTEYSGGAIRNKLVVGKSRITVYLAGYLACAGVVLLLFLVSSLAALALGSVLFSAPSAAPGTIMTAFFVGAMTCLLYAAVFYFIAVICGSRVWAAIFSILLAVALLMAASELSQTLEQGPYTMQLVPEEFSTSKEAYSIDGVAEDMFDGLVMETVPNPNYLSGEKREIVQLFYDINPAGQTTQLARLSEQDILYPLRIILLDAGLSAVFALGGIWIFRRKDIK
ncbi:ABC transporter permease subunit [Acutalibacter caecimuris]|uniref:ABC transporter permease subunit n=1 Tax=Acutalibacter caecimuris TaxID=3093657 RepID=UPI002AC970B3|nr:ABC transporter permease subunit [Acutalibacter sp. M00118]